MNETKYAIVIDENGYKVELVLVQHETKTREIEVGETYEDIEDEDTVPIYEYEEYEEWVVQYYVMQDGASLVYDDVQTALSMYKPRWTGDEWEETGEPPERPEPPDPPSTDGLSQDEMAFVRGLYDGAGGGV